MSTLELKKNLIQRIVEIDDVAFLKAIKKCWIVNQVQK